MPITLHCESCKKKIKAPDTAGGKWGNCPYCKHKCYIPLPPNEDEPELRLIPLDASEETQFHELMNETQSLTKTILKESTPLPEEAPGSTGGSRSAEEKEVIKSCILYLRQMADGNLDPADKTLGTLKKNKRSVLRILASMARAERPEPELADISEGVLQGLIRDVATKLG
ncbi:MAG: hypothetical protein LLF76_09485 [Planctomycetaceae bacterium]|nr:hypothetical protein [Planctomycetaceae bacterium]